MRIISQDGCLDFSYEKCFIWLNGNKIRVLPIGETDSKYTFGIYSTSKKAEKAMEMLHEKYKSILGLEGGFNYEVNCYVQPNYWVLPKIFQFPKDDEVTE